MDFISYQKEAKRKTFWLIFIYALCVFFLSLLIFMVVGPFVTDTFTDFFYYPTISDLIYHSIFSPGFFITASVVVLFMFYLGRVEYLFLKQGGFKVAESMGAILVNSNTEDFYERRLLNIVEEMALASGLPVPPVYLLDDEKGINAFAAGFGINDAVIGVTRGSIELLSRDELQAVIAHEFSHILNRDMRLNIHFAVLIFGFMFVFEGAKFMLNLLTRSRSGGRGSGRSEGALLIVVLAFFVYGFVSSFMGRIVQAAVNRQREYLADASAVQFTRNKALASALKKIGGYEQGSSLNNPMVSSYSHFFFGPTSSNLLSTHPDLAERIYRIEPDWDGMFSHGKKTPEEGVKKSNYPMWIGGLFAEENSEKDNPDEASKSKEEFLARGVLIYNLFLKKFETVRGEQATEIDLDLGQEISLEKDKEVENISEKVLEAVAELEAVSCETFDAAYIVLAILLSNESTILEKQLACLNNPALALKYKKYIDLIPSSLHLNLVEKTIPALKELSKNQYIAFEMTIENFVHADKVYYFEEWILFQLIKRQVGAQYKKGISYRIKYRHLYQVQDDAVHLLFSLSRVGGKKEDFQEAFKSGLKAMGLDLKLPITSTNYKMLEHSLATVQQSSYEIKQSFLKAALAVAEYDENIVKHEAIYLRILHLCLDSPDPQAGIK